MSLYQLLLTAHMFLDGQHKETGQLKRRVVSVHFQQKMGREKTKEKAMSCSGLDPRILSGPKVLQTQRSCHESSEPWRTNKQRGKFSKAAVQRTCVQEPCAFQVLTCKESRDVWHKPSKYSLLVFFQFWKILSESPSLVIYAKDKFYAPQWNHSVSFG